MKFKRVADTINRPHFLVEGDDDVLLLNFQEHKSMRCRRYSAAQNAGGLGSSMFDNEEEMESMPLRPERTEYFNLRETSKHGLGAHDGKVYFLDDSPRTDLMSVWRVDSETGDQEFTKTPPGYITRFSDSDYFLNSFKGVHAIYQWKTGEEAEMIRRVRMPNNLNDHTRIAYGSKMIFVKIEGRKILITSTDVISEKVLNKIITLDSVADEKTRWFAARNHLIAVVYGRIIFIDTASLAYEIATTNLDPAGKYHPFAVDSKGFVYVLCPTTESCTVQRARDHTLAAVEETRVVIPKQERQERVRAPKKERLYRGTKEEWDQIKYINVTFHVTHMGRTLFNHSMKILVTVALGDVIRRSPEITQPANTRLKLFYKNEEHLSFRTPNFLRMRDGDTIYAEFVNKDLGEAMDSPSSSSSTSTANGGVFSREMLDEMDIDTPEVKKPSKKKDVQKPVPQERKFFAPKDSFIAPKANSAERSARTSSSSSQDPFPHSAQLRVEPLKLSREAIDEKLLSEMEWLRNFVEGKLPQRENGQQEPLELLQKKYARVLMMMGRSSLKK